RSDIRLISCPPRKTRPEVIESSPARLCIRVDLPEPAGPMIAVDVPRGRLMLTPSRARTAVGPDPYTLVRLTVDAITRDSPGSVGGAIGAAEDIRRTPSSGNSASSNLGIAAVPDIGARAGSRYDPGAPAPRGLRPRGPPGVSRRIRPLGHGSTAWLLFVPACCSSPPAVRPRLLFDPAYCSTRPTS